MSTKIIAEIGINHNGDLELAKKLISAAYNCGVDLVKFQKRDINLVYTKEYLDSFRESPWGTTQREQKDGLEFKLNDYQEIDTYCKKKGIEWFASAWDLNSLKFLEKFLKNLEKNQYLDKINLTILSDHGSRIMSYKNSSLSVIYAYRNKNTTYKEIKKEVLSQNIFSKTYN